MPDMKKEEDVSARASSSKIARLQQVARGVGEEGVPLSGWVKCSFRRIIFGNCLFLNSFPSEEVSKTVVDCQKKGLKLLKYRFFLFFYCNLLKRLQYRLLTFLEI